MAYRNHVRPYMCKEPPPETAGKNHFSFTLHTCHQTKDLVRTDTMFNLCLIITKQIKHTTMHTNNPMQHKLPVIPLIKDNVPLLQSTPR